MRKVSARAALPDNANIRRLGGHWRIFMRTLDRGGMLLSGSLAIPRGPQPGAAARIFGCTAILIVVNTHKRAEGALCDSLEAR
jgi:hypothetical protein